MATVGAGIVTGLSVDGHQKAAAPDPKKILNYQQGMVYRRLGATDVYLSVLSLGGLVMVESVDEYAVDKGVNLIHAGEDYLGGRSIVTYGNILKKRRDKVYVALKDDFSNLDDALRTLNTDYVDFLMLNRHSAPAAADRRNLELFEQYKKQGKVRYLGLTSHGNVKEATAAGIDSGMFSIVMPALNQPSFESLAEELRAAQAKGVGVMAMKTMRGLRDLSLQAAYVQKLMANPAVTTIVKGMESFEMFDAYQKALQQPIDAAGDRALYRHAQANRSVNCMMCDECHGACPSGVEVSAILRCADYYYGQLRDMNTALATYRSIPEARRDTAACRLCARCERVCPNGIRIVERLEAARHLLA
ncbi:MAG: aldo/keto reductase [Planctomycetes bacterium]|nr:aldo/keto reductase [Planctomycetota bacterium]